MGCCHFIGPYSGRTYYCQDCDADPSACAQGKCGCYIPDPPVSPGQLELPIPEG
jgi:hypothetical protein